MKPTKFSYKIAGWVVWGINSYSTFFTGSLIKPSDIYDQRGTCDIPPVPCMEFPENPHTYWPARRVDM